MRRLRQKDFEIFVGLLLTDYCFDDARNKIKKILVKIPCFLFYVSSDMQWRQYLILIGTAAFGRAHFFCIELPPWNATDQASQLIFNKLTNEKYFGISLCIINRNSNFIAWKEHRLDKTIPVRIIRIISFSQFTSLPNHIHAFRKPNIITSDLQGFLSTRNRLFVWLRQATPNSSQGP